MGGWRTWVAEDRGQTVVIVALMFTLMMGFAALSLDVGRFYAERRFLQDGADAAALACARAYAQSGGTSTTARAAAVDILDNYNLKGNPLGLTVTVPGSGSETYWDNMVAANKLKSGILPQTSPLLGCRVALYIDAPTILIKIVNPDLQTLAMWAQAYATAKGGFLPVVVPKYSNGPGPGDGSANNFLHHTMREGSDYQCSVTSDTSPATCLEASTTTKGRAFVLFGAGQKASNDNSFRGYIALDVRDFTTTDGSGNLVHQAYNGVAPNESINTLKDFEANWIYEGYPGPDLCIVSSGNFLPCAQVAVINGASAGQFIPPVGTRYKIGDVLLAQLYDSTVKTIPNFTINFPTLVVASETASVPNQNVSMTFSSQFQTSAAQVTTTFVSDNGTITGGTGDALNPWNTGNATSGSFATNPTPGAQASYTQIWSGITTTSAPKGLYVIFLRGVAGAPYAGVEQVNIVTVNVASQQKQFFISTSDTYVNVASVGTVGTYTVRVTDGNGLESWNGGASSITLQIDQCPKEGATTLTCYFGATAPGTQTLTTSTGANSTLTVETTGATNNKTYTGWIRAYGTDAAGKKVTRVLKIRTGVNVTAGGTTDYVDVVGYAVFEVTNLDSNDVFGQAITPAKLDYNDPALAIGKKYGLVPWEQP